MSRVALVCLSIALPLPVPLWGHEMLDAIVVTGTKTERTLMDTPVRTEVISAEETSRTHARNLAEALQHQPGILLKEIHGKSGTEVWLQGLNSDRVLVLVDGRPVSASTGSSVDLSQLAVGGIEQIEIVKGAVSALHGSAAMGGVVNIITRRRANETHLELTMDAGSYGDKNLGSSSDLSSRHLQISAATAKQDWVARINADWRDSDGFDLDHRSYANEGDQGPKFNLSGDIGQQFKNGSEWLFSPAFYREDLTRDFSTFAPGVGEIKQKKREKVDRLQSAFSFKKPLASGAKLSGYAMHERFEDTTEQDVNATDYLDQQRIAEINFNKAELQWDQPWRGAGGEHLLTLGLVSYDAGLEQSQQRFSAGRSENIVEIEPGAEHRNLEFFLQDDWTVSPQWEWLPGLRYQRDSDFGEHLAPKVSALYRPDWFKQIHTRIRFGVGQGYRVPNLKERYFLFDHSALGYVVLGNPQLQAETSTSYQASLELSNDSTRAEIALFHNDIRDLISTDLDAAQSAQRNLGVYRYVNVDQARSRGIDLLLTRQLSDNLNSNLGYSYLDAIDSSSGKQLTRRPEHQLKLGLDWKPLGPDTEISLRGQYQSDEYVDSDNQLQSPAWKSIDLKLNHWLSDHSKVFIGIDNLGDEHRDPANAETDFRPKKSRFIYAGVHFTL